MDKISLTTIAIQEAIAALMETIKELLHPNMALQDIASECSPHMDNIIRKYQQQGLVYSAGKFKIVYVDEVHFAVGFELYFQNAEKKWQQVSDLSKKIKARSYLTENAWNELYQKRIITYDVQAPVGPEIV